MVGDRMALNPARAQLTIVLGVLALGVCLRFVHLETKMYSHDEAYTSLTAAGYAGSDVANRIWVGNELKATDIREFVRPALDRDVSDTLSVLARSDPHQSPLFFLLAHGWMRLVGSSPGSLRCLAALLSLPAIPGAYWLALELFASRRTALLSAALVSLSPFQLLFAQDARPYSLLASMTLVSSGALLAALRRHTWGWWGGYAASLIVGWYAHELFALVVLAHGCYVLVARASYHRGSVSRYVSASCVALLAFTPWLAQTVTEWRVVAGDLRWMVNDVHWSRYLQRWALVGASPVLDLQFGPSNVVPYVLRLPTLVLIAYAFWFLVVSSGRRAWALILLLVSVNTLPFVISDLLLNRIASIQGRYFVSAGAATILAVAHLLSAKTCGPVTARGRWMVIAGLVVGAQAASGFNSLWATTWWNKNLGWNTPAVVGVLNEARHPVLIVSSMHATDLGDVLALSLMVKDETRFRLFRDPAAVELPAGGSETFLFHERYSKLEAARGGTRHVAVEVVPGRLWRIYVPTNVPSD